MKSAGSRLAGKESRAVAAVLFSALLASCSSTGGPNPTLQMAGYSMEAGDSAGASAIGDDSSSSSEVAQTLMTPEGDTDLPAEVAYLPTANPGTEFAVLAPAGAQTIAGHTPQSLEPGTQTATEVAQAAPQVEQQEAKSQPAAENSLYVTADETPKAEAPAPKKKGFFASLFGSSSAQAKPAPIVEVNPARAAAKPVITLASADASGTPLIDNSAEIAHASMNGALPGVRQTALFEIKRKSGLDDDSDVDLNEDEGPGLYQLASAAGMARLAPNGLLKQTEGVDVACLKPSLVRVLKTIESHYGKKMIVTSGYRDSNRNRRANGARNSLHMYCAAADIQIPGVSKWELANYARTMPGRGGVGTYCHTESVHVDVGPERDWNWRCRRRK